MGYGQATVVSGPSTNSGSPASSVNQVNSMNSSSSGQATIREADPDTLDSRVRTASEQAIKLELSSGGTKRDALIARDIAMTSVYTDQIVRISAGGESGQRALEEFSSDRHAFQAMQLGVIRADGTFDFVASQSNMIPSPSNNQDLPQMWSGFYYNIGPGSDLRSENDRWPETLNVRAQFKSDALGIIGRLSPGAANAVETGWDYYTQVKGAIPQSVKDSYQMQIDIYSSFFPTVGSLSPKNRDRFVDGTLNTIYGVMDERDVQVENIIAGSNVEILGYNVSYHPAAAFDLATNKIDGIGRGTQNSILKDGETFESDFGYGVNKFLNPLTSMVRGATTDNLTDYPGLLSIYSRAVSYGYLETEDVLFNDKLNVSEKWRKLNNIPEETGAYFIGKLVGGMIQYAVDDPWAAVGSITGPAAAKSTLKLAEPHITGEIRTVGREHIPYTDLTSEKVYSLESGVFDPTLKFPDGYPTMRGITIEAGINSIAEAKNLYPNKSVIAEGSTVGVHVHKHDWAPGPHILRGKSAGAGFFVGHNVSPRFSQLSHAIEEVGPTFLPGDFLSSALNHDVRKPTIMFIETPGGISRLPEAARYNLNAANEFIRMEADPRTFWITKKMETNIAAGNNVEIEAVLPNGTIVNKVEGKYYTKFPRPFTLFGRSEIFGIKLQQNVKVPIDYYRNSGQMNEFTRLRGTAIVEMPEGILLVQEKNGLYGLPGGGIEGKEVMSIGTLRELREETGIKGKNAEFLFEYNDPTKKRAWEGGMYNNDFFVYRVADFEGVPKAKNEVSGIDYYNPGSNLPLTQATRTILNKYYHVDTLPNEFIRNDFVQTDFIRADLNRNNVIQNADNFVINPLNNEFNIVPDGFKDLLSEDFVERSQFDYSNQVKNYFEEELNYGHDDYSKTYNNTDQWKNYIEEEPNYGYDDYSKTYNNTDQWKNYVETDLYYGYDDYSEAYNNYPLVMASSYAEKFQTGFEELSSDFGEQDYSYKIFNNSNKYYSIVSNGGNYGKTAIPGSNYYNRLPSKNKNYLFPAIYATKKDFFVEPEEEYKFDYPDSFSDYDDWFLGKKLKRRERRDVNPIMNIISFMGL